MSDSISKAFHLSKSYWNNLTPINVLQGIFDLTNLDNPEWICHSLHKVLFDSFCRTKQTEKPILGFNQGLELTLLQEFDQFDLNPRIVGHCNLLEHFLEEKWSKLALKHNIDDK